MTYLLTAEGHELAACCACSPAGAEGDGAEPLRRLACGSEVEAPWHCPTCARPVDEGEASSLRYG